jgi:Flp pilus assembly protein TadB
MGRRGSGQGPQRPVKGFRPGKEPPHIRKQQAKQQFANVDARQERLIEMFAERTPAEAKQLIRSWRNRLLAGAAVLGVLGAVLYVWSLIAGLIAHAIAAVVLFFGWRFHRQRGALEAMADAVNRPTRGGRRKR